MANDIERSRGRGRGYKHDRGGQPTEFGPYIGEVRNNIDPTRSGRLQVYIEEFAGPDKTNSDLWKTVSYLAPFYGATQHTGPAIGSGKFIGNRHSYGMWFTPPDIGTRVMCFFPGGDFTFGYYVGCVVENGVTHMLPAIGSTPNYSVATQEQSDLLGDAFQLPTTEYNEANPDIYNDPRFFDRDKPIHESVVESMFQQGLIKDTVRGPITSSAQRESPSSVFGLSTPGRPVYQGGMSEADIRQRIANEELEPQDVVVRGRRGGHSIVLDDGDIDGIDNLIRIRTSKGHQITMSDDGDCFYITHANGQSWIELGREGTVDVYSTNSVNVRTEGSINLHANEDINIEAGRNLNMRVGETLAQESQTHTLKTFGEFKVHSDEKIKIKSDGSIATESKQRTTIKANSTVDINGGPLVRLNTAGSLPTDDIDPLEENKYNSVKFDEEYGWGIKGEFTSVTTRAPTHEPWTSHNLGVETKTDLTKEDE